MDIIIEERLEKLCSMLIKYQVEYSSISNKQKGLQLKPSQYIITKLDNLTSYVEDFYMSMLNESEVLTSRQKKELLEHQQLNEAINKAKPLLLLQMINKIDLKLDNN